MESDTQYEVVTLIVVASLSLFAAIGGLISHHKNRQPLEGVLLGAVLGPIGLLWAARQPFAHRPMIDRGAWNSFRSMVEFQSDEHPTMLQLPAPGRAMIDRRR